MDSSRPFVPADKPQTAFFAVDIEVSGRTPGHPIFSVGWCFGTEQAVMSRGQINIRVVWPADAHGNLFQEPGGELVPLSAIVSYGDFDPEQWANFWCQQPPSVLRSLAAGALEPVVAWPQFVAMVDSWDSQVVGKITPLSDCVEFDIGRVTNAMWTYCGRRGLGYNSRNEFRTAKAADDLLETLPPDKLAEANARIASQSVHDHTPINDAYRVYLQWIEFKRYMSSRVELDAAIRAGIALMQYAGAARSRPLPAGL